MEDYMVEPAIKILLHISRVPQHTITLEEIEEHFHGQGKLVDTLLAEKFLEWHEFDTYTIGGSVPVLSAKSYRLTAEGEMYLNYWRKRRFARFFSGASGLLKNLLGRIFPGIGQ